jgi:hypothetical protein
MFTPSTYPTGSLSQYSAWVTEGLFSFMRRMQDGTSYITNQYNVAASTPFTRVPLLRGLITQKTDLIIRHRRPSCH